MPVYNDADRLNVSIGSILSQTLSDIEIICVNDGSTDNSLEILKGFEEKYDFIKVFSQDNQGSGKARNFALDNANGDYIAFLDADDIFIDNDSLERLFDVAIQNDANMVSGNIQIVNEDGEFTPFKHLEYFNSDGLINPEEYGIPWSFYKNIFKKDFLLNNKIYFPDLLRGQDPVFLAEVLSKVDKIYTVSTDFYAYYYVSGVNQCNTFRKRFDHMLHFKYVFDYLSDSKFDKIKQKFRYEMFSFFNFMGEEAAEDLLTATRGVFANDGLLLRACEYFFYDKYKDHPKLKDFVQLYHDVDHPRVSVLIPVYNAEDFLEDSVGSLLNQTLTDIEIVCVNDGSKDNSLKMLQSFAEKDNRIKLINQENGGCGAARNKAIDNAKGDYIYFLDPDDHLVENALEELYINAFINDSDLVLFKLAFWVENKPIDYSRPHFDLDNYFKGVDFNYFTFNCLDIKKYVMNAKAFAPWFKLYKREFLKNYDDFYFPINLPFDDVPFHIKSLLRASKMSFLPKFFYHYRIDNPNSINSTPSNGIGIIKIISIVEDFLKNENYFEDFEKEFYNFKLYHTYIYLFRSADGEEYFRAVKREYEKIKRDFFDKNENNKSLIDEKFLIDTYNMIMNSNSFNEFKLRFDMNKLEIEYQKLKNNYNKVSGDNKNLLSSNNDLSNKVSKLSEDNKNLLSSNNDLSNKVSKLSEDNKNLFNKLNNQSEMFEKIFFEISRNSKENTTLINDVQILKDNLNNLESLNKQLVLELNKLKDSNFSLNMQNKKLWVEFNKVIQEKNNKNFFNRLK